MEAGIVGLPNVGKSTLFNALTAVGIASENYPFCTIEAERRRRGDSRSAAGDDQPLHRNAERSSRPFFSWSTSPGWCAGASRGEGLGNKFLGNLRNVDAILHVVRCYEDENVMHVEGSIDPIRDIDTIDTELMLADLQSVEGMIERGEKTARTGGAGGQAAAGDSGRLPGAAERRAADSRPVVRRPDVGEDSARAAAAHVTSRCCTWPTSARTIWPARARWCEKMRQRAAAEGSEVVPISARLEAEIAELEEPDRSEMLQQRRAGRAGAGGAGPGRVPAAGFAKLFHGRARRKFGPGRFPIGATAPQAAGVIHSDFERGFIRVEVYSVDDLVQYGSEKAIREAGKMRLEGKSYVMQDSDVCHFLVQRVDATFRACDDLRPNSHVYAHAKSRLRRVAIASQSLNVDTIRVVASSVRMSASNVIIVKLGDSLGT